MKERLTKLYQKYIGLIFRIGLMITTISVWDSLGRTKRRQCIDFGQTGELSERQLKCMELRDKEGIFSDIFVDLFPLVIFLSVFYVLFWFIKKR